MYKTIKISDIHRVDLFDKATVQYYYNVILYKYNSIISDCRVGRVKYDISRFEISINLNGNSYDL